MSLGTTVYNVFFKRTSTYVLTMAVGAFVFERTFDIIADGIFYNINKGKLWKDIKHKYENKE